MNADDLARDLIQAFVIKEQYWKACGADDRVAGIRECISHLQDYRSLRAATPSSGVTEGKAESGEQVKDGQQVPDRNHALNVIAGELSSLYGWLPLTHRYSAAHEALAEVERRLGLPVGRDLFPRRGPLEPPQPAAPADDTATVLAGLRVEMVALADDAFGFEGAGLFRDAVRQSVALVEAAQQRLADRGQSGMPDEFEPYLAEAMKRPGFRAAYEAALRDEENTDG